MSFQEFAPGDRSGIGDVENLAQCQRVFRGKDNGVDEVIDVETVANACATVEQGHPVSPNGGYDHGAPIVKRSIDQGRAQNNYGQPFLPKVLHGDALGIDFPIAVSISRVAVCPGLSAGAGMRLVTVYGHTAQVDHPLDMSFQRRLKDIGRAQLTRPPVFLGSARVVGAIVDGTMNDDITVLDGRPQGIKIEHIAGRQGDRQSG
jgi:hypothetical protein